METPDDDVGMSLEEMRCWKCSYYLSSSPIRTTFIGENVCNRCANSKVGIYRNVHLEAIAAKMSFPCNFDKHGCKEVFPFDQAAEHEEFCERRRICCPYVGKKDIASRSFDVCSVDTEYCQWKGEILDFPRHFRRNHPDCVSKCVAFFIPLNNKLEKVLLSPTDKVSILVKCCYNPDSGRLTYEVHCLSKTVIEATYEILLISVISEADHMFFNFDKKVATVKGNKCIAFTDKNCKSLNLNDFAKTLGNPAKIKFEVRFVDFKYKPEDLKNDVDYDLLNELRCESCIRYLLPPIYDTNEGTVCCLCSDKFEEKTVSSDMELTGLLLQMNYPCRWRQCGVVMKGAHILGHEKICQHCLTFD